MPAHQGSPAPPSEGAASSRELRPLRTTSAPKLRQVGFTTTSDSPSSVLRGGDAAQQDSPGPRGHDTPAQSPLAAALRRELSAPQLPQLPKLKLGLKGTKSAAGGLGMPRSKSHGNLRQASAAAAVPAPAKSAASSPHAASSGGSEPVRIPLELARRRRRTVSVDYGRPVGEEGEEEGAGDPELSTSVISAASSLLGHHWAGAGGASTGGAASAAGGPGSAAGSPSGGPTRSASVARDLYLAQADAVTAHAQVQGLQTALRREQDEVLRLREQLQLMTAERDRLLSELQLGGAEPGGAPVFEMEGAGGLEARPPPLQQQQQQRRPLSGLRTALRLP